MEKTKGSNLFGNDNEKGKSWEKYSPSVVTIL